MNEAQKQELFEHIKQNDNVSFLEHAKWASMKFGVLVTGADCLLAFLALLD